MDSIAHHRIEQTSHYLSAIDSVFVHDSIWIKERLDTVWVERWHTYYRYRDRTIHDTLRLTDTLHIRHTDTLRLIETHIKTQKEVPRFYKNCTAGFFLLLLAIIAYIALRLAFK